MNSNSISIEGYQERPAKAKQLNRWDNINNWVGLAIKNMLYLNIFNLRKSVIMNSSRLKVASFVISSIIIHNVFYKSKAFPIKREHPIWTAWSSLIFTDVPMTFMASYELNWSVFHIATITSVTVWPNFWKNVIWICISALRIHCICVLRIQCISDILFAFTCCVFKAVNIWSTAITTIIIAFRCIDIFITLIITNCMFKSCTIC